MQKGRGMEIRCFGLELAAQRVGADHLQYGQRRAPLTRRRPAADPDLVPREHGRLAEIHARGRCAFSPWWEEHVHVAQEHAAVEQGHAPPGHSAGGGHHGGVLAGGGRGAGVGRWEPRRWV